MKLHPRTAVVNEARKSFNRFLAGWQEEFKLTACEELCIFNEEISDTLKYCLRTERKPEEDRRKGERQRKGKADL